MLKKLLPRNVAFFDFFERHAETIVQGAKELLAFSSSEAIARDIFREIKLQEQEADRITHQCVETLHKTFITPFERTDIHRLISTMDDVIDEIEDVARFVVLYKLQFLRSDAIDLVHLLVKSTQEVQFAIKELKKMRNTEALKGHFFNIYHLENEADTILIHAISRLFDEEEDAKTIIKWKEVYEHLEKAVDLCEDVANIIEGIILEYE